MCMFLIVPFCFLDLIGSKNLRMICGDLDSVQPKVLSHYEKKCVTSVKVVKDTDQYSTDIAKCLKNASVGFDLPSATEDVGNAHPRKIDVIVFGGLGGRADQAFSLLHHLYADETRHTVSWLGDMYLITPDSLIFLLEKGLNRIRTPMGSQTFTQNVGIIPLGRPSIITTRGLEWDVTAWPTEFGAQISTSNHIKADSIEIESTERILITLEYHSNY